ncbi:hypothetical protein C8J57DRAFT_1074760, partial [Mycena rebaudengoi]
PDINLIKHAWEQLDHQLRAHEVLPRNCDELWEILKEQWENLNMGYVNHLYDSTPRRVQVLHDAKGQYTKYQGSR